MEVDVVKQMDLDEPLLIEGFPGAGLVAKIVSDYIVEKLDMELYAEIYSEEVPNLAVFEGEREIRSPVRVFADEEEDIMVLKSDAPVSSQADGFLEEINSWMENNSVTPIYQVGVPAENPHENEQVFGVSTGDGAELLEDAGIRAPGGFGLISGPTGGLLSKAAKNHLDAVGVATACDPQFPDPASAKRLIDNAIEPLTGLDIGTKELEESAEQIKRKKQQLAQQVQKAQEHEKSQAYPTEMYS